MKGTSILVIIGISDTPVSIYQIRTIKSENIKVFSKSPQKDYSLKQNLCKIEHLIRFLKVST